MSKTVSDNVHDLRCKMFTTLGMLNRKLHLQMQKKLWDRFPNRTRLQLQTHVENNLK